MLTAPAGPPAVLLDACVLVPTAGRELLFQLARQGVLVPRWSARIEGEWRAAAIKRGAPGPLIDGEIALARAAFPGALVAGWEAIEDSLALPDWNDRHVLAAAIAAGADVLVTDNVRDFPRRALAGHGVQREALDPFLWGLLGAHPEAAAAAIAAYRAGAPPEIQDEIREDGLRKHFKRARLPRFGKAAAELVQASD